MSAAEPARSVLIASEPLTADASTWLEVPEYALLAASVTDDALRRDAFRRYEAHTVHPHRH